MATIVALIVTGVAALASPPPAVPVKPEAVTSFPSALPEGAGPTSLRTPPGAARVLACIRRWESLTRGLYHAVSLGGKYRGAYQFSSETWIHTVLGLGRADLAGLSPDQANPSDQDLAAAELYRQRGLAPWPTPARMCH